MYGADVDQPAHAVLPAQRQHIARAFHVDAPQFFVWAVTDVDQPGGVDDHGARRVRALEKGDERFRKGHVAGKIARFPLIGGAFMRQHQPPHLSLALLKQPHDGAAQMPSRSRHNPGEHIIHSLSKSYRTVDYLFCLDYNADNGRKQPSEMRHLTGF